MKYSIKFAAIAAAFSLASGVASAQSWPSQPITLIVPFAAGGGADPVARLVADGLSERLGQSVLVDFRPGAGGTVGTSMFLNAESDGHTLLLTSPTPVVNAIYTTPELPYDADDARPIALIAESPTVVAANVNVKASTLADLFSYAKENPGDVSAAISGAGTVSHLAVALMEHEAGVEFNVVPYGGSGAQLADLMSGVVDFGVGFPAGFMPGVASGRLKILGTLGPDRLDILPDVVSTREIGYDNMNVRGWFMVFAHKDVPEEVLSKVRAALNDLLAQPDAGKRLADLGYNVVADSTAESARQWLDSERTQFKTVFESGRMDMSLQ
jgi:tripartite-type tricarboxylate transporter receptor subunit TctC